MGAEWSGSLWHHAGYALGPPLAPCWVCFGSTSLLVLLLLENCLCYWLLVLSADVTIQPYTMQWVLYAQGQLDKSRPQCFSHMPSHKHYTCTFTQACTHTFWHKQTQNHTCTCIHTYTCSHTSMHTERHMYSHAHQCVYSHTCTDTYT